jgi:multidrug efflux pump subunit AcrA (membrane-fusion protein)
VRVAQVRARVNGVVLKRLFTEGSEVKAGQVLFQIDPGALPGRAGQRPRRRSARRRPT